jgi:transglutaminase-like putative cysteine protease
MTGSLRLALAAAAATVLASLGLQPLVDGTGWARPALVAVALVLGVGVGLRWLRAPAWSVVAAQGLAVVLWVGHLVAPAEARLGWLPSRAWADALADTAQLGADTVATFSAPVPLDSGILLLVVGGVGLTAWAVDALAVTARQALWAGVPLALVHGVAMASDPQGPSAWAFVAAALGFLLLLVVDGRERAGAWGRPLGASTSSTASAGTRAGSLAAVGWPLALAAVAIAVAGSTLLPQTGWALLGGTFGGGGGSGGGDTIRTENPIVDLKRDLVQPENVEVLRLTTTGERPDYLKQVTLDVYDGTLWRTSDRPVPESQRVGEGLPVPPGLLPDVDREAVEYQVEVSSALQSPWLPLPYPAQQVQTESGDWRYDAPTLDVVSTDSTTQDLRYDVTSLDVRPTPQQLAGTGAEPGRLSDLLALPADLDPRVVDLAREVTADAVDPYDRAVALQQWFRQEGGFVYDLTVAEGNAQDDLLAFLADRRGYCEQYAATMAIMARAVGIPARVAVGYLRGVQEQPGLWVVRAQDAHAWPELYFEGVGWLRFEPTPSARTGSAPDYTQAAADVPSEPSPQQAEDGGSAAQAPPAARALAPLEEAVGGAAAGARPSSAPLLAVLAALTALAVMPWLAGVLVRRRRWARAGDDPVLRAEAAWAQVQDTAWEVGLRRPDGATVRSTAADLAAAADLPSAQASRLQAVAVATERARFAPAAAPADALRSDADAVRAALLEPRSRRTRWFATWWPAPVRRLAARLLGR